MNDGIFDQRLQNHFGDHAFFQKIWNFCFIEKPSAEPDLLDQLPIDAATGVMAEGAEAQARQSLENIKHILEEAGLGMANIVKTTVFLADMSLFADMNKVYATYFDGAFPARSAVAVKALPKDALVEIECIAVR